MCLEDIEDLILRGKYGKAEEALAVRRSRRGEESCKVLFVEALLRQCTGNDDEAIRLYNEYIEVSKDGADARLNLGLAQLRNGNLADGWKNFEYRDMAWNLKWAKPNWKYGEDLRGRIVGVLADEGIGDTIMFGTLLAEAAEECGELHLFCEKRLETIMKRCMPQIHVHTEVKRELWGEIDVKIRISSLASIYRNNTQSFDGKSGSYLTTINEVSRSIKDNQVFRGKKLIGVAWSGGLHDEGEYMRRRVELDMLMKALDSKEFCIISFQHGSVAKDINRYSDSNAHIVQAKTTGSVDGLAHIVEACDLIVSCEQSLVHIAGALGKKSLVLLGSPRGWRYIGNGTDSEKMLWYSSVKMVPEWDSSKINERVRAALRVGT